MNTNDGRHALVLSGGGAYGAYEVGVMKTLFNGESAATGYTPLEAEVFTGTSAGALNAAFMTMHPGQSNSATVESLEQVWIDNLSESSQRCGNGVYRLRGDPLRYFDPECLALNTGNPFVTAVDDTGFLFKYLLSRGFNFIRSSAGMPERALQMFDLSAFISVEPLRQTVRRLIQFEGIRRSDKKLRIATTNWNTGKVKVFENREMTDELGPQVLEASTAIPGIFPPVKIGDDTYVDGGVVSNTPLKCAIDAEATVLHVVYLDPDVSSLPIRRLQNSLDTLSKLFTVMFATISNEDIDHAREINMGLDFVDRISRGETLANSELRGLIRFLGWIEQIKKDGPYKRLTIHRYRPPRELAGALGMLNFNQKTIVNSIEQGVRDTIKHDCAISHCVLAN